MESSTHACILMAKKGRGKKNIDPKLHNHSKTYVFETPFNLREQKSRIQVR